MEMSIRRPVLQISRESLVFTQADLDKPCFLLLTVAQQFAETPVTIETDSPDYFLLATDSQPNFRSKLTFVPSSEGTYVHIRYASPKRTINRGFITITSPYDTQTVGLEGRTAGFLAVMQQVVPARNLPQLASGTKPPSRKGWIALVVIALISGLAYVGVRYQCQLFPSTCQTELTDEAAADETRSRPAISGTGSNKVPPKRSSTPEPIRQQSVRKPLSTSADVAPAKEKPAGVAATRLKETKAANRRKPDATAPDKESELERELNGKPDNN